MGEVCRWRLETGPLSRRWSPGPMIRVGRTAPVNNSPELGTRTSLYRICGSLFAAKLAPNFAASDKVGVLMWRWRLRERLNGHWKHPIYRSGVSCVNTLVSCPACHLPSSMHWQPKRATSRDCQAGVAKRRRFATVSASGAIFCSSFSNDSHPLPLLKWQVSMKPTKNNSGRTTNNS